jgi:hypothetical protein
MFKGFTHRWKLTRRDDSGVMNTIHDTTERPFEGRRVIREHNPPCNAEIANRSGSPRVDLREIHASSSEGGAGHAE